MTATDTAPTTNPAGATQVEQWGLYEVELHGPAAGNPFLEVTVAAQFSHDNRTFKSDGFYDGDGTYRIRFMPDSQGEWSYRTSSNVAELDGQEGSFTATAPSATNHGPVRVADAYHFVYADGTPYHPVGTTCYVWNLQGDELEEKTLATLAEAPFNKMRMCVFPKHYVFNNNEPPSYPFPGEVKRDKPLEAKFGLSTEPPPSFWDFSRFNPEYFQHLENRILDLQKLGIEADLILFHPYDNKAWGFDRMPAEVNTRYLRYIVARLSAIRNVWWSFANEYDLMLDRTMEDWDSYFQLVQQHDPYDHLRSVHNVLNFYDHTKPWVTHCSVQHGELAQMTAWQRKYGKPVVVDECGYEGNINQSWGDLSPQEMLLRFWLGFAEGGYVGHGETYLNDRGEIWWSKGGELVGESVPRIAFLRRIIEAVPGAGLEPLYPRKFHSYATVQEAIASLFAPMMEGASTGLGEGGFGAAASGHSGSDYYLLYFGPHQPAFTNVTLPEGSFSIDIIDTWEMTINRFADNASGQVRVDLPGKQFQAIRIERTA